MRSKSRTLTIDEVRARFEEWRQNRKGKSPIPDELWAAAAELARKDGINRTAAELHLDGGKLKAIVATEPQFEPANQSRLPIVELKRVAKSPYRLLLLIS